MQMEGVLNFETLKWLIILLFKVIYVQCMVNKYIRYKNSLTTNLYMNNHNYWVFNYK